ncbi:MAG: sensor histidine kinase [Campylobacterota bacterium]|nr:sensor histidine kinase [Campylobacterota bacterium]
MLQLLLDIKHHNPKIVMLYRFHIAVIFINIFAVCIDIFARKYTNVYAELGIIITLLLNLYLLRQYEDLRMSAYIFIFAVSTFLFSLIYMNHFASMSVAFILLLPLATLLFLHIKESLFLSFLLFLTMGTLLYLESVNNPINPLVQNAKALFTLSSTALIIYFFGLLYHFSILKTFKELDASNIQKALLLKEVHHRVKNNLNVIASIIGLQENTLEGKEKEELLKSKSRIESIALVHEMLYRDENFESIDFNAYMQRLSTLLLQMYASDKNIEVNIESDIKKIPLNVMVQLGIMINELITNSIKYAFERGEGKIHIVLKHDANDYLFMYSDDGVGYEEPDTLVRNKSLGMKLIHLTAKQLKGSVEISNAQGLKYKIRFKA